MTIPQSPIRSLLFDTQAFLWADADQDKLSPRAKQILASTQTPVFLSIVSIWEVQIKVMLGKMTLRANIVDIVEDHLKAGSIKLLSVQLAHVRSLQALPNLHRDPFDRMLIAQAVHENMTLISSDSQIAQYPIPILW